MLANRISLNAICLAPLSVCLTFASASEFAINESGITRSAAADGALIAMALFCKRSRGEVGELAVKLEAETLALALKHKIAYDSNAYREEAKAGMESTAALLRQVQPSTDSYAENCREIADKIRRRLAP